MKLENPGGTSGIYRLHHVNLITTKLTQMIDFYVTVLKLETGERPPFLSSGAWLYAGDQPVIHLVEGAPGPREHLPQMEHFAFAARGLPEVEAHLRGRGIAYRAETIPGVGWPIVVLEDTDGNKVEIVFPDEAASNGAKGSVRGHCQTKCTGS